MSALVVIRDPRSQKDKKKVPSVGLALQAREFHSWDMLVALTARADGDQHSLAAERPPCRIRS